MDPEEAPLIISVPPSPPGLLPHTLMRCPMKLRYATLAIAGFVLSPTPALAAPQSVEDACWRYAQRVTPYLTECEKEAYITNSIADWTDARQTGRPV
jgi:hypothetical protein